MRFAKAVEIANRIKVDEFYVCASLVNPLIPYEMTCFLVPDKQLLKRSEDLLRKGISLIAKVTPTEQPVSAKFAAILPQLKSKKSPESELDRFFERLPPEEDIVDPLFWWNMNKERFPSVFVVAKKFLAPATSVKGERLFSVAGHVLGNRRMLLSPARLEASVLFHSNYVLVDKKILSLRD